MAAVERAARLLECLAEAGGELGVNEIARRIGVSASTVSRLLATLAAAGLVAFDGAGGRYRLGLRLVQLGNAALAGLDLRQTARPHLEALVAETGETATLSIPADPDPITADFVQSPSSVQSVARLGRPSVSHATAVGKVALAFGSRPLPSPPLRAFTARTLTDPALLAAEVARVREEGWARAAGEREEDLNAVAAPVLGPQGELQAILGLQGPASRFHLDAMQAAAPLLMERARELSTALGWREWPARGRRVSGR